MKLSANLIRKYNIPVPRYTSYPTVPFWKENIDTSEWLRIFQEQTSQTLNEGISLYIHLPFCESLCTFCGCNKKITTNHAVESKYIDTVLQEWDLYLSLMNEKPLIKELHLGGGTPTFFTPKNLERLITGITQQARVAPHREFSFEGHPNNTTKAHLSALRVLGFNRVSFGVQDNDPEVQRLINRIQPFEKVIEATENARQVGYESVNFDLIYGLPRQSEAAIRKTFREVISLMPDRIAFYSYAHVPWVSRGQRLFDESDLPKDEDKLRLYLSGKELLLENGYADIGMDHFALPQDDLFKAWQEGWLHRNFMGYTTQRTASLLGLGVSSISDTGNALVQNHKKLSDYYTSIEAKKIHVIRGYFLNEEDLAFRKYILDISCQGKTIFHKEHLPLLKQYAFPELEQLAKDGLTVWDEGGLTVTQEGRQFVRNICRAFDLHLWRTQANQKKMFSKAV